MMNFRSRVKALAVTVIVVLLVSSEVYAVEPWSNDLWKDDSSSTSQNSTGAQQSGNSGGGLWSEELWPNSPAPQPTLPPQPPIQGPEPADKPLPANDMKGNPYLLVMQVENNKALVRGAEKELLVPPTIINGRMMVPIRFVGEALNASLSWSGTDNKTTVEFDGKKVEFWQRNPTASVDGNAVKLETPPVVLDGSTLVPISFISEYFGYPIEYDSANRIIKLAKKTEQAPALPAPTQPTQPAPEQPEPEVKKPVIDSTFNYFGEWELRTDAFNGSVYMGTIIVKEDGTYGMKHGISGTAVGTWRQGEKDEVIGQKDMLILENGPGRMDWVMVPKSEGLVSVRYHYGYDIENKIWFVDSLGAKIK